MTTAAPILIIAVLAPPDVTRPEDQAVAAILRRLELPPDPAPRHRPPSLPDPRDYEAAHRLNLLGRPGLAALLDRVFPDTARPPEANLLAGLAAGPLITRLGADDFRERQASTRQLVRLGPGVMPAVRAAERSHPDPEVRLRAGLVWSALYRQGYGPISPATAARALRALVPFVRDPDRLELLADRVAVELAARREAPRGEDGELLSLVIGAVVRARSDRLCDRLRHLLDHPSEAVAAFVIDRVGRHRGDESSYPRLLLDALGSGREAVVAAALAHSGNRWNAAEVPGLRRELWRLFDRGPEAVKFGACLPLARDHQDPDAFTYLLTQLASRDGERARTAAAWLREACATGHPAVRAEFRRILEGAVGGGGDRRVRDGASELLKRLPEVDRPDPRR